MLVLRSSLFLVLLLSGCASFRPVPSAQLEARGLVGHWRAERATMSIHCSGAFDYQIHRDPNVLAGDLENAKCSGCVVNELRENEFIVGPMPNLVFRVQQWPREEYERYKMKVDGREWTRELAEKCR